MIFGNAVSAYEIGDVVNTAVRPDICAYIFYQPIDNYNINGYTYIRSADLDKYGFDVEWDAENRVVNITRNYDELPVLIDEYKNEFEEKEYSQFNRDSFKRPNHTMKLPRYEELNVLYTDIKVYIDGEELNSYNIEGNTVIMIDELQRFGRYVWDEKAAVVTMELDVGNCETECYIVQKVMGSFIAYDMDGKKVDVYIDQDYWKNEFSVRGGGLVDDNLYPPPLPELIGREGACVYYKGELKNGRPDGYGRIWMEYVNMVSDRGYSTYNGMFENGKHDGMGIYTFFNSYGRLDISAGEWENGKITYDYGYITNSYCGMWERKSRYYAFNGTDSVEVFRCFQ